MMRYSDEESWNKTYENTQLAARLGFQGVALVIGIVMPIAIGYGIYEYLQPSSLFGWTAFLLLFTLSGIFVRFVVGGVVLVLLLIWKALFDKEY